MVKIKTELKFHLLLVTNLKVGPTMIGVRYVLALIPKGAKLFSDLDFKVGTTSGFIRLNLRELCDSLDSNCKLFEINYSQFEGPLSELGNCMS